MIKDSFSEVADVVLEDIVCVEEDFYCFVDSYIRNRH